MYNEGRRRQSQFNFEGDEKIVYPPSESELGSASKIFHHRDLSQKKYITSKTNMDKIASLKTTGLDQIQIDKSNSLRNELLKRTNHTP